MPCQTKCSSGKISIYLTWVLTPTNKNGTLQQEFCRWYIWYIRKSKTEDILSPDTCCLKVKGAWRIQKLHDNCGSCCWRMSGMCRLLLLLLSHYVYIRIRTILSLFMLSLPIRFRVASIESLWMLIILQSTSIPHYAPPTLEVASRHCCMTWIKGANKNHSTTKLSQQRFLLVSLYF